MSPLIVNLSQRDGRYHRQELISWWDQRRLGDARVLVVGAGALGNELVKNLALLGVGTVLVADMDRVEDSNLSRGVLLREQDEGLPKAEVVAAAAARLNPDVCVIPIVGDVRTSIGLGTFRDVDLVLGGLDNREARVYVNQACWKAETPWIDGAIEGLLGVARVFVPPHSACYECTMNEQDRRLLATRRACSLLTREQMLSGKVPTTVTSASVIAAVQVQEAVKLLHADRLANDFAGHGYIFNGITHDSYAVAYQRHEDCLAHDSYDGPWQPVSRSTPLRELLHDAEQGLGAHAQLSFEHDIALAATCQACDRSQPLLRPLTAVRADDLTCPACGSASAVTFAHSTSRRATPELLARTPAELDLPPRDVITIRNGDHRLIFQLDDRAPWR